MPSLRPTADALDGGWRTNTGGTSLHEAIDEETPSDSDFVRSTSNPMNDLMRIALSAPGVTVDVSQAVTVRYRIGKSGPGVINMTVRLKQGATVIAAWEHLDVPPGYVTLAQTLTSPQKAAITNWGDLFLEIEAQEERFLLDMSGLTDGVALIGTHPGISVTPPVGVTFLSQSWGVGTYGNAAYGGGSAPSDFAGGDGLALVWQAPGSDGNTYRATAPIRQAAPQRTSMGVTASSWLAGATVAITRTVWNVPNAPIDVIEVDENGDGEVDDEFPVPASNAFTIPSTGALGFRYRLRSPDHTTTGGSIDEAVTAWSPGVAAAQIAAVVAPASARLHEGKSLNSLPNWTTFLALSNYTSTAGAIVSVDVQIAGVADAVTPLVEGQVVSFSILVEDALGNTKRFDTAARTVEFKARAIRTAANAFRVEVNPIVAPTEPVSITIHNGPYAGVYSALAEDFAPDSDPFPMPGTRGLSYSSLDPGSTIVIDPGLFAVWTGALSLSFRIVRDDVPVGSTFTALEYELTEDDLGTEFDVEIIASDGVNTTTVRAGAIEIPAVAAWDVTFGNALVTINATPPDPTLPAWNATFGDAVVTITTSPEYT